MMKTLTQLREAYDSNPGNDVKLGVTNHLTPLNNIITNVRNLFATTMGIVVEPGEDGVSLKLHSSKFVCPNEINKILNQSYLGDTCLHQYICQQGLCNMKLLNLGSYYVVYFGPNDIRTAENPDNVSSNEVTACNLPCACKEMLQYNISEVEMETITEAFDDEELEDKTKEQLLKFIQGTDKVKCAQKLAEFLADDLNLPEDYYFKGVKDTEGNESIALRYKFQKRRPFGKEVTLSKTLINIYNVGENAVWVEAFLTKDKNSDTMNRIVETVLKLIGAQPTEDPCVYVIPTDEVQQLKKEVEDNQGEDKKEEPEENLNKEEKDEISGSLQTDNKTVNQ